MLALGASAPSFSLHDANGKTVSLDDFADAPAYVVVFICNHCPFVRHLRGALAELGRSCAERGIAMVAINSNDFDQYPDDTPDRMRTEAQTYGYSFPYLVDADQSVAKSFEAACTPDFYVFDAKKTLVYRGQYDDSRPGNDLPVNGNDLLGALESVLAGNAVSEDQKPSLGCNIKWKPGKEPDYFG